MFSIVWSHIWHMNIKSVLELSMDLCKFSQNEKERDTFRIGYDYHNDHTTQSIEVCKVHTTLNDITYYISLFERLDCSHVSCFELSTKNGPVSMISIICSVHMTTHWHTANIFVYVHVSLPCPLPPSIWNSKPCHLCYTILYKWIAHSQIMPSNQVEHSLDKCHFWLTAIAHFTNKLETSQKMNLNLKLNQKKINCPRTFSNFSHRKDGKGFQLIFWCKL